MTRCLVPVLGMVPDALNDASYPYVATTVPSSEKQRRVVVAQAHEVEQHLSVAGADDLLVVVGSFAADGLRAETWWHNRWRSMPAQRELKRCGAMSRRTSDALQAFASTCTGTATICRRPATVAAAARCRVLPS